MDTTSSQDYRAGIQSYLDGDYMTAERQLADSLAMQPVWSEGWSYLGFAQYMLKKYPEASASLERAVMMDSESAEARYGLGLVHAALKRVDAAIACWDEAVRLKPSHADAKRSLVGGLIFRAQQCIADKDYDRAEHDLERAIKIDRTQSQAPLLLAQHFVTQNMTARAQKVVQEALAHLPKDPAILSLASQLNVQASKAVQATVQQQQTRQQVLKSQEVPCPACKQPVMEWAAICPHCNTQIKALPSTFAGRKEAVPITTWQVVAYYVMTVLWIVFAAIPILLLANRVGWSGAFNGILGFISFLYSFRVLVGLGMLFQQEFIMSVAKFLCYATLFFSSIRLIMSFFSGQYLDAAIGLLDLCIAGFMVYLLNYMGAD